LNEYYKVLAWGDFAQPSGVQWERCNSSSYHESVHETHIDIASFRARFLKFGVLLNMARRGALFWADNINDKGVVMV